MFHLFTETSVFVPLPNECLCQMIGEPIIHLKPPPIVNFSHALQEHDSTHQDVCPSPRGVKQKPPTLATDDRPSKRLKTQQISPAESFASSISSITASAPQR
ncbi:hypothetical protein IEO21_02655 [Rhodonia placenta]|uniref:Uncharacterized protein n=1 Tax=Rhodonia placenta TaxID=104341 RepID=A0A8H7U4X1_9APHY|nr:hypothetical protein IEO21_02655 [Postia placenta]